MRRGNVLEQVLAGLGVVVWFGLVIWDAVLSDYTFFTALVAGLGVLSVVEILRWQKDQSSLPITSRKRANEGLPALPQTAWFGAGAGATSAVVGAAWGFLAALGVPVPQIEDMSAIPGMVSWIVGGFLVQWLLTRASDRRMEVMAASIPPSPIPMTEARQLPRPPEPSPMYSVWLQHVGQNPAAVERFLMERLGYAASGARSASRHPPQRVKSLKDREQALAIAEELRQAGGSVEVRTSGGPVPASPGRNGELRESG